MTAKLVSCLRVFVVALMLLLIPLLPFLGFLLNASLGRRLSKAVAGAVACAAMVGVVRRVARRRLAARSRCAPEARVIVAAGLHLDHVRRLRRRLHAAARSAVGADDPRRHRHRLADSHLLDRLHARGARLRVRALLLVPEPLRGVHARARARRELPGDVRRLGGRRPLLVPADRLLVSEEVGGRRRQEGVHRQPHRRLRLRPRRAADLRAVRHARLPGGRARASRRSRRRRRSARSRSSRCCCSSARPASRRRFRCTSGCRTRWKARRRSRRSFMRRRW